MLLAHKICVYGVLCIAAALNGMQQYGYKYEPLWMHISWDINIIQNTNKITCNEHLHIHKNSLNDFFF